MGDLKKDMVLYRARERITQEELGRRCGLTKQSIMNIERGNKIPSRVSYAKIRLVIGGKESNE